MKKLLYMYKYTGKYWIYAILCPIFMVAEAVVELQVPEKIGDLINFLQQGTIPNDTLKLLGWFNMDQSKEINVILILGLIILLISLLSLICGILGGVFASYASSGFSMNLKNGLFEKVQSFSFANIDKYSTSSLITRMTTDTNWIQMSFQMSIRMLFRSPALFIYAIIKAKRVSSSLSLVYFIAIPVIVLGLVLIFLFSHPLFERGIKKLDNLNEVVEENIRGIRVVKSFTREKDEIKKFDDVNNSIYKTFKKAHDIVNLNGPVMNMAIYAVLIVIAFLTTKLVGTGQAQVGDISKMMTYSFQILSSLMMISMMFSFFIISKPSRDRVYEVLHEIPTIRNSENPVMEVKNGDIEFNHVFFKYSKNSEKYVLNDINLKINSGETLGILGTTGSSKTTLISLIARLYDATEGEVKLSGINVKDIDLTVLRDAVAVVLQKNVLFSGTIKDNLKWGKADLTDEEMVEASKIAQADSFISLMKDKYDTYIEQGGSNVSGGQKQRLCIARAILKDPKVLILDDSMSAVDTKTDKLIRNGLKEYRPDITKIIVAQRCASVMDADKIIIIDNGEIIACGKHTELLKTSTAYQEVYYSQNSEEANKNMNKEVM